MTASSGSIRTCWATSATNASRKAPPNATRTPQTSPNSPIIAPPKSGPSAIGIRRTSECTDTPIVRLFFGSARAMSFIVAGSEIAVHDRKRNDAPMTACHFGTMMTTRNPAIARRLNTSSARLVPSRSARYPPGTE